MWSVMRRYVRGNDRVWSWCQRNRRQVARLIEPPSGAIWSIGNLAPPAEDEPRFREWAATASVFHTDSLEQRLEVELGWYHFPDRDEQRKLKWFASEMQTDVMFYAHETWGGHTESE